MFAWLLALFAPVVEYFAVHWFDMLMTVIAKRIVNELAYA